MANMEEIITKTMKALNKDRSDAILVLIQEVNSKLTNIEDKIYGEIGFEAGKELIYYISEYPEISLDDERYAKYYKLGRQKELKNSPSKEKSVSMAKILALQYKDVNAVYEAYMQELMKSSTSSKPSQPGE